MLTFDYCESVGAVPQRLESLTQLQALFQREDVRRGVDAYRAGDNEAKRRLPAVCWQATFGGQKRANKNATPSGFFMLDIDHVSDVAKLYREQIKPHLEEEQICFVHISPSGEGLRVVARCKDSAAIAVQQERLARALGVPFDAVCKDMARLSFIGRSDEILYVDARLFEEEGLVMAEKDSTQQKSLHTAAADEQPARENAPHDKAPMYRGCNLQDFVEAWMAARGGYPEEGVRNHTYYALGRDLRYLCNFSAQTMARCVTDEMLAGFPRAELLQVFESACQSTRRSSFPPEVEQILGTLQGDIDTVDGFERKTVEKMPTLPDIIDSFVKLAPEDFKAPTVVACLPILGTICSHIRGEYLDGEMHSPSFMTVIEAEQASGKSFTRRIVDTLLKPLKDRDEQARQVEQEYQRQLKMNRNKADQPEDPRAKVRIIPASVSVAKLLQRMDYAQGQHLFSFCEEIDTLYKSNKAGSWSQKSDIYRNAFDNAEYGQDYMSENSYSTIVRVFYNLLLCGTPKAVTRFFPDCEDGLVSRVIFCHLPDQFAAQFPKFRAMLPATEKRLQTLVRAELGPEDGAKPLHTVNCDFLNDRMAAWLEAKRVEALKTLNKAEDQFRRRAAVIGFRAGMLAYYLSGEPKNKAGRAIAKEFAVWVANYVLAEQLGRFADQVNTTVEYKKRQVNCVHVFDSMPSEFSRSELVVLMNKHGYKQSARQTIWRWKREGLIVKSGGDMYSKVANKEENQDLDDSLNDSDNEVNSEVAGEAITKAR